MQILIADDNDDCRLLIRNALRPVMGDSQFVQAEDGAHAWWLLTETGARFDLCIIDISMPRVDGFSLVQRIRENPSLASLPVILCTAMSDRQSVAKAAQFRVNGYIAKPYTVAGLQARVLSVIAALAAPPAGQPAVLAAKTA